MQCNCANDTRGLSAIRRFTFKPISIIAQVSSAFSSETAAFACLRWFLRAHVLVLINPSAYSMLSKVRIAVKLLITLLT